MLLFPDNFITVCFYYMIINIHQGHDAFVPSDDAGIALTKKVNMFPFNRSPYSRKQYINCEPVTKVKEFINIDFKVSPAPDKTYNVHA